MLDSSQHGAWFLKCFKKHLTWPTSSWNAHNLTIRKSNQRLGKASSGVQRDWRKSKSSSMAGRSECIFSFRDATIWLSYILHQDFVHFLDWVCWLIRANAVDNWSHQAFPSLLECCCFKSPDITAIFWIMPKRRSSGSVEGVVMVQRLTGSLSTSKVVFRAQYPSELFHLKCAFFEPYNVSINL